MSADVLDQAEVDALLAAVNTGEVQDEPNNPQRFSKQELDEEVRPYDFKRPERVSKDQMRALQTLHESFARSFGASLSAFLRTIVEVKVSNCEQMTYSEFIAGLPNPTSFNLLDVDPLEGQFCFEVAPLIIYPIIDRLLGGTNQELFIPQRPLTVIESRLIEKITERAIEGLKEAWESVRRINFKIAGSESNPQLVQIVPPNEVAIVVGFEMKLANRAGTMNLCIPYAVIEPLMDDLAAQSWFSAGRIGMSDETRDRITSELRHAPLNLTGLLAETSITLRQLIDLQEGDLITTDKPATDPVLLCIEDEPKFLAELGKLKDARAMQVLRPVGPDDRLV